MRRYTLLFRVEAGLAAVTGLLALLTPIVPDWIEAVSGWDPDQHDGSTEWLIVGGLLCVAIALAAAIELRRAAAAAA